MYFDLTVMHLGVQRVKHCKKLGKILLLMDPICESKLDKQMLPLHLVLVADLWSLPCQQYTSKFTSRVICVFENFRNMFKIIHSVLNGKFRQYKGSRDIESFMTFIEEKKWEQVEPVSSWKAPDSIQMSVVSSFFKLSQTLRVIVKYSEFYSSLFVIYTCIISRITSNLLLLTFFIAYS